MVSVGIGVYVESVSVRSISGVVLCLGVIVGDGSLVVSTLLNGSGVINWFSIDFKLIIDSIEFISLGDTVVVATVFIFVSNELGATVKVSNLG